MSVHSARSSSSSAVAVNDDVVPRAQIDAFPLHDGDTVEIIVAVAGG